VISGIRGCASEVLAGRHMSRPLPVSVTQGSRLPLCVVSSEVMLFAADITIKGQAMADISVSR
jgi:hypothetical protein